MNRQLKASELEAKSIEIVQLENQEELVLDECFRGEIGVGNLR